MKRRNFLVGAVTASCSLVDALAQVTTGTRTIVVPYGPGGLPDGLARVVGKKLSEAGQPIVENKPGASGIIGAQSSSQDLRSTAVRCF